MRTVGQFLVLGAAVVSGCASPSDPAMPGAQFAGCSTYPTRPAAQRAWERAARPASTDGDRDGRVCESLPTARRSGRTRACRRSRRVVLVRISARHYPLTADHVGDAIAAGHPRQLHLDRPGAKANRAESLAGIPTRRGYDRDEYPPAVSREGGKGADVRYVPSADNRGAGSVMGDRLERYCDGQRFRLRITDTGRVGRS
jgi:Deoxyribonuclease NucA/NucB